MKFFQNQGTSWRLFVAQFTRTVLGFCAPTLWAHKFHLEQCFFVSLMPVHRVGVLLMSVHRVGPKSDFEPGLPPHPYSRIYHA